MRKDMPAPQLTSCWGPLREKGDKHDERRENGVHGFVFAIAHRDCQRATGFARNSFQEAEKCLAQDDFWSWITIGLSCVLGQSIDTTAGRCTNCEGLSFSLSGKGCCACAPGPQSAQCFFALAVVQPTAQQPADPQDQPGLKWTDEQINKVAHHVRAGRKLTPKTWPNGARVAVCLSVDPDNFSIALNAGNTNPVAISAGEYGALEGCRGC